MLIDTPYSQEDVTPMIRTFAGTTDDHATALCRRSAGSRPNSDEPTQPRDRGPDRPCHRDHIPDHLQLEHPVVEAGPGSACFN